MSQYLSEAFKRLDSLNEETFSVTDNGLEDFIKFEEEDEFEDVVDVIDPEAETEEDLEDSYIGKVILDCCVCHSKIYKNVEDVVIEGDIANVDEECPFCYTTDGYKVIGQVASFGEEEKKDDEDEPAEEESPKDESLKENIKRRNRKSLKEGVDSNIYGAVGRHYNYNLPSNTAEVITDLVERAIDNKDSISDTGEAVMQAIDEGLIYHRDIWAIKEYYEDAELADETYEELFNDVYSIVESLDDEDVNESKMRRPRKAVKESANHKRRTRAQRHLKESYTEVDTIECGEETYRVVGGVFNTRNALVSVEDDKGNTKRLSSGDVIEFYTWYDRNGKVIHEPSDDSMDESIFGKRKEKEVTAQELKKGDILVDDENGTKRKVKKVSIDDEGTVDVDFKNGNMVAGSKYADKFKVLRKESLKNKKSKTRKSSDLDESKSIKESVNNVNVETDDSIVNVTTDDNGKVTVSTEPITTPVANEEEVITPLEPEVQSEISDNVGDGEEIEIDVDEFDEESFDDLGEGYLKRVYENVNSFKTTNVSFLKDKLILEGVIKFNSGKSKKTNFIFGIREATKSGKVRFIGENKEIARGRKSFTVTGRIENKKFLSESFNYNYGVRNANGKAQRLYGTIKNTKRGK